MGTTYSFSASLSLLITTAELNFKAEPGWQPKPYHLTQDQWGLNFLVGTNDVTRKTLAICSLKDQPNMTRNL